MNPPFVSLCPEITRSDALTLMDWLEDACVTRHLSDSRHVSRFIEQAIGRVHWHTLTQGAKLVALTRKGRQARSEDRATGSVAGVHALLRLAYVRARVFARAQTVPSRLVGQEVATRQYRHPARSSTSPRRH